MKLVSLLAATMLALGLLGGTANAQSDRTLGIHCTVAGHEHCGENGRIWGAAHWHHRHYRHSRHVERMSQR